MRTFTRGRSWAAAGALVAVGLAGIAFGHALRPDPAAAHDYTKYPPCKVEDGPAPCIWLAFARGNGTGRSFVIDADGMTRYFGPDDTPARPATPGAGVGAAAAWRPFRDVEGHHGCAILVGDTSRVRCADGWETES